MRTGPVFVLNSSKTVEGDYSCRLSFNLYGMVQFALQTRREEGFRAVLGLVCTKFLRLAHGHQWRMEGALFTLSDVC